MILDAPGKSLRPGEVPTPEPGTGQVRIRVSACGVCRTDLHIIDGELARPKLPLILGHQIVGTVDRNGAKARRFHPGDRIGVPWLGWTDGDCEYCRSGRENLCDNARFTGYDIDGGYADYVVADERFCLEIPAGFSDLQVAPLLCAGLIGYRAYTLTQSARRLGLYGFGNAAHILTQVARHQSRDVYAFTRPGDTATQQFARQLGAVWAGGSDESPPQQLDGAILFAGAGELIPAALRAVAKGGVVVCAEIHMTDVPSFPYDILWGERAIRSVANLTRKDGEEFLALVPTIPVHTDVQVFPLARADDALDAVRRGAIRGAAVLVSGETGGR